MNREPGKRDYGSSDAAHLRSLASRGVPAPPRPARPASRENPTPRHERRPDRGRVPA
ncbi:hypothetical protein [Luteibacter sahnii]|uniref:hypothetical protein n=1 Tax=Luteibacter sahnii TaxID=3021977 RepID=UPI002A6A79D5|nr:hypothetical protein [Luteibacter sp. PPL193]MDY1549782.1 hypothetical protein [Luteibacter sp. PPL193]